MSEAIAGYWKAIGAQVELAQPDPSTLTAAGKAFKFTNHGRLVQSSSNQFLSVQVWNSALGPRGAGVEDPEADVVIAELNKTLDEQKLNQLWQKLGGIFYDKFESIPLFWTRGEMVVNPKVVADYVFPGRSAAAPGATSST